MEGLFLTVLPARGLKPFSYFPNSANEFLQSETSYFSKPVRSLASVPAKISNVIAKLGWRQRNALASVMSDGRFLYLKATPLFFGSYQSAVNEIEKSLRS